MSTLSVTARAQVLDRIRQAQSLLLEAYHLASPLQGWAEEKPRGPYYLIGDHYDATKALWHAVNDAPLPTGHDDEPETRTHHTPKDLNKRTAKEG